jgi:hypothetical protein
MAARQTATSARSLPARRVNAPSPMLTTAVPKKSVDMITLRVQQRAPKGGSRFKGVIRG